MNSSDSRYGEGRELHHDARDEGDQQAKVGDRHQQPLGQLELVVDGREAQTDDGLVHLKRKWRALVKGRRRVVRLAHN